MGAVYRHFKSRAQKKADSEIFPNIPFAPGAHWLVGHLVMLRNKDDFERGYKHVYVDYADPKTGVCSLWFVTVPAVNVLLGHHVKSVLAASSFRKPVGLLKAHNDNFLGSKALVTLMGKDWRKYRSAVHKSFTPAALKEAQSSIHQVGKTLVGSLLSAIADNTAKSMEQPILPLMKMATIDVFGLAAMDIDFECCKELELTKVAYAFEHLNQEFARRLATPLNPFSSLYWLPTKANKRHRSQRNIIRQFIAHQIAQTRKEMESRTSENKSNNANTLLANILRTAEQDMEDFSDEAIGDIMMTLLFGGYDTTSITLSYALYLLATNPTIQSECVKEVETVFTADEEFTEDELPYTRAVVLEVMRLYPPAPVTARNLEKPMELVPGTILPKGTMMLVPIWSIQRDERNFERPLEMLPERWVKRAANNGSGKGSLWEDRPSDDIQSSPDIPPANRDAFCVFSAGARNCVGRKLAIQEAVTLLAHLVEKLKFEALEEVKPVLSSVLQQPDRGLPMRISARK